MSELTDTLGECNARLIEFKHETRASVSTAKPNEKGNRPCLIGTFRALRGRHAGKMMRVTQALDEDRAANEAAYVRALRGHLFVHGKSAAKEATATAPAQAPTRPDLPTLAPPATSDVPAVAPEKSA